MKIALITGVTGQDGAYLAEFLLKKGYEVHGIKRRSSLFNTERIDHLYRDPHEKNIKFKLHYGDLTDSTNLIRIIQEVQPDEIYNLGAMSHVKVSFETPEYSGDADGLGTLRILEAVQRFSNEWTWGNKVRVGSCKCGKFKHTPTREWLFKNGDGCPRSFHFLAALSLVRGPMI